MKNNLLILFALFLTTIGYSQFTIDNLTYYIIPNTNTVRINSYNGPGGAVIIPATVTAGGTTYDVIQIDGVVFYQKQLTSVILPNSITSIGSIAFGDNQLTSIVIPNSVTTLGNGAFQQNQLTSVTIPGSISVIESGTFQQNLLTTVTLSDGISTISDFAFYNNQLQDITIPNSMTMMGNSVFDLNPLSTVTSEGTTPAMIETFSQDTFGSNRSAIDLTIPPGTPAAYIAAQWTGFNSVTEAFEVGDTYMVDFITYEITSTAQNNAKAIDYDMAGGTTVSLPTTIPNGLLNYNVTEIGDEAFRDKGLTSVDFPSTMTNFGFAAFAENELTTISIPDGMTSIGDSAFSNNMISSVMLPTSLVIIEGDAFKSNNLQSITIPDNVTTIEGAAFAYNDLTTVALSSSLTTIGQEAFAYNEIASIDIPDSVTTIVEEAFLDNKLTSVSLGSGLTTIANGVFGINELTAITIPDNITSIGEYAFFQNLLTEIVFHEDITSIGSQAFQDNLLTDVFSESLIPPTITTDGGSQDTFDDRSMIDLHIPEGTTNVYVTNAGALWTGFNTVTEILGTSDFALDNAIKIVTSENKVSVVFSNNIKLQNYTVYGLSGAKIATGNATEISTTSFASGVYVIKLDFNKGTLVKKVLVK